VVDVAVLVREYLLGQTAVTSLLGTNKQRSIYAAYDLPEGFDPKLGPVIQLFRAGGKSHAEIDGLLYARLQVRTWADVEQYLVASNLYSALHDVLHGLTNTAVTDGTIKSALEVTGPQEMTDTETGWVSMYAFYAVMAAPNS
jgi:hypothetical protein